MPVGSKRYDQEVRVKTEAKKAVGTARFRGRAERNAGQPWTWGGQLFEINFETANLPGGKLLLVFPDGSVCHTLCTRVAPGPPNVVPYRDIVVLRGDGTPPGVRAPK